MKVKIKRLNTVSIIPSYAKKGDAGMDLTATRVWVEGDNICYGTGLAMEIPEGYVGLLFPRSSNSKKDLLLCNSVGVIDSGYRGEVIFKFRQTKDIANAYAVGERIGQIIVLPYPLIEFEEAEELSETSRGGDGFGSTGK